MANKRIIANRNAALVLEVTAGIDKYMLAKNGILAKVRIKKGGNIRNVESTSLPVISDIIWQISKGVWYWLFRLVYRRMASWLIWAAQELRKALRSGVWLDSGSLPR